MLYVEVSRVHLVAPVIACGIPRKQLGVCRVLRAANTAQDTVKRWQQNSLLSQLVCGATDQLVLADATACDIPALETSGTYYHEEES